MDPPSNPAKLDRSRWEGCEYCKETVPKWYLWKFCPDCGKPLTEEAWAELERRIGGNDETSTPTITPPPNDPMTLEELRRIFDGEEGPIWVVFGTVTYPTILDGYGGELVAVWSALGKDDALRERDYGSTWRAYRRKPEEARKEDTPE